MTPIDTGMIDIDGGRLYWQAAGSGKPMILLHGFSFDHRLWDPQMPALTAQHRVVRYDLRGFGGSTVPRGPYRHLDDLRELIERLNLRRPLLVGLSLGANVALAYSIAHAADVGALVLASPGLPGHRWRIPRPPEVAAAYAAEHGVAAGRKFWLEQPIFHSLRDHPAAYRQVADMVGDYSGWHWQNADPQQPGPDVRAELAAIGVPTLIISGGQDVEGYREIAEEISRTMPGAELTRMMRAGHVMNLEEPAEFTAQVLRFGAVYGMSHDRPVVTPVTPVTPVAAVAPINPVTPGFDLDPPGTYLFDGRRSTQGFALNRFALSLKQAANRERFLRDEQLYLSAYDLSPECRQLIRDRDWSGLLQAGGHLQALLKLAATVGQSLYHIGAHNCGIAVDDMRAACPRHVTGIGRLDRHEG